MNTEQFQLVDDGTLDTVIRCTMCGREARYNYNEAMSVSDTEIDPDVLYEAWVEDMKKDMAEWHGCKRFQVVFGMYVEVFAGSKSEAMDKARDVLRWADYIELENMFDVDNDPISAVELDEDGNEVE